MEKFFDSLDESLLLLSFFAGKSIFTLCFFSRVHVYLHTPVPSSELSGPTGRRIRVESSREARDFGGVDGRVTLEVYTRISHMVATAGVGWVVGGAYGRTRKVGVSTQIGASEVHGWELDGIIFVVSRKGGL